MVHNSVHGENIHKYTTVDLHHRQKNSFPLAFDSICGLMSLSPAHHGSHMRLKPACLVFENTQSKSRLDRFVNRLESVNGVAQTPRTCTLMLSTCEVLSIEYHRRSTARTTRSIHNGAMHVRHLNTSLRATDSKRRFHIGLCTYTAQATLPFAVNLQALPNHTNVWNSASDSGWIANSPGPP